MELYILNDRFLRVDVIDDFESLIWTERWQSIGDFELIIKDTLKNRGRFEIGVNDSGVRLGLDESRRIMVSESIEYKVDQDGREMLYIKGRSQEKILQDRVVKKARALDTDNPTWLIFNVPRGVVMNLFNNACRAPTVLHIEDALPLQDVVLAHHYPLGGTLWHNETIWHYQEPDILYNAIQQIVVRYNLGFRMLRHDTVPDPYFQFYWGYDRTRASSLDTVLFDPEIDNFHVSSTFKSVQNVKNVLYAYYGEEDEDGVYKEWDVYRYRGFVGDGFDRRVMLYKHAMRDGTVVDPIEGPIKPDPDGWKELNKIGTQKLSSPNYRPAILSDGVISQTNRYQYDKDYYIGDLVEVRNNLNAIENKRVTECVFVSDMQGDRIYPTFANDLPIEEDYT